MCFTDTASMPLDQISVIGSFLAVSRRSLDAKGPRAGGSEAALKSTLSKVVQRASAVLSHASSERAIQAGNSGAATKYANCLQANDAQTTHEVSRLLDRRVIRLFANEAPRETALGL
ncbi:MAG: hypothetical protein H6R17_3195 [Proteobacteria bacterium]|nr:hypothetical protein [Pseudomonadota bacterium]